MTEDKPERIAKVLARAGLCSRREAERWIEAGRVKVDGTVLTSPAVTVDGNSKILVDGKPLPQASETRLWLYHKPSGLVTSHSDPQGRPTVFSKLPKELGRVISVGRLDLNSEGLLLLTNDGELARKLEMPSTGWERRYRVRVKGQVDEQALSRLKNGITVAGIQYGAIDAKMDSHTRTNAWLTISLREGKNREIRKVMEFLDLEVNRLIRTSYGPFRLGTLARGAVAGVADKTLRNMFEAGGDGGKPPPKKKGWAKKKPTKARK